MYFLAEKPPEHDEGAFAETGMAHNSIAKIAFSTAKVKSSKAVHYRADELAGLYKLGGQEGDTVRKRPREPFNCRLTVPPQVFAAGAATAFTLDFPTPHVPGEPVLEQWTHTDLQEESAQSATLHAVRSAAEGIPLGHEGPDGISTEARHAQSSLEATGQSISAIPVDTEIGRASCRERV